MRYAILISALLTAISPISSFADTLKVAVASNFTRAMEEISTRFQQQSGHQLQIAYGSSGKFYAQIQHGAPFQVFLSADQAKPAALIKNGLALADSRFSYAIGALALWSQDEQLVDNKAKVLTTSNFTKLAIANPKLAPYGAAAMQTLTKLGLNNQLQDKLVLGENISQTYQFVVTGNAQLGFVALSQVMAEGTVSKGSFWPVPAELHDPIKQDAVLLKNAENSPVAQAFIEYLQSEEARQIIEKYGYKTR